jgi:hypothetical protein
MVKLTPIQREVLANIDTVQGNRAGKIGLYPETQWRMAEGQGAVVTRTIDVLLAKGLVRFNGHSRHVVGRVMATADGLAALKEG